MLYRWADSAASCLELETKVLFILEKSSVTLATYFVAAPRCRCDRPFEVGVYY